MRYVLNMWEISQDILLTILVLIAFLIAVYLAIVPHEIAHGLVAKWNGDLTAKVNGRLSMNPVVHFDLIGFIMLVTVGFGFAKPVPVNSFNYKVPRRGLFTVAIAGVTYNFAAMLVSCFFFALVLFLEPYMSGAMYLNLFLYYLFLLSAQINMMLFLFNIIPLGPLDGFKMLEAYPNRGNKIIGFLRTYGTYILIGLFLLNIFASFAVQYIEWVYYIDILGLYLRWMSHWIGGGVLSLFTMMFGMGNVGLLFI